MKFFIATLIATLAAADDWAPKAACLTYLDEQARWLAPRADVAFAPKGADDWDSVTVNAYDAQITALKNAPAGELSEANRDVARSLLNGLDWETPSGTDVDLSTQTGWPTYDGDYAADCVEPIVPVIQESLNLENPLAIVTASLFNADERTGIQGTIVTGWKQFGGGSDAGIGYQLAFDFFSETSWDSQGGNAVTLIFGNDSEVTELEYNEFNVINFASAAGLVRMHYNKRNLDAGTKLPEVAGYAQFTDDKKYTVSWTTARGNWASGAVANIEYGANVNTAGFWNIVRDNTKLLKGQEAADETQILLTVQKETLGSVTTGIKAGGSIDGKICFKSNVATEACTVASGVSTFEWKAEPVVPDNNGGNTDNSGDDDTEEDSAVSMAAYGASFLAAISALAF